MQNIVSYADIGRRLRQARKKSGVSQKELGDLIGRTGVTISYYELGKSPMQIPDLCKIANRLNTTLSCLLGISQEEMITEGLGREFQSKVDRLVSELRGSDVGDSLFDELVRRLRDLPADVRHEKIQEMLALLERR